MAKPHIYTRVSDLFDVKRGKSIYTKTYCENNVGPYPVYSADNNNPLGYKNSYDYDGRYLTVSVNGIAGVMTIFDKKFFTNADRVAFVPKERDIDIEYVKNILEPKLRDKTKGRKGLKGKNEFTKLSDKMIEDELIPIPYNMRGLPFIEKQIDLAKKYKTIDIIKRKIDKRLMNY